MALPEGIPTVTLTGKYLAPDGRPVSATAAGKEIPSYVEFRPPAPVTFPDHDVIHVMDARRAPGHLYHRDLVIAGDVLEHMERDEAVDLLRRIEAAGAWHILISVPIVDAPQGAVEGNEHETHVHHWDAADMDTVLAGLGGRTETWRGHTLGVWWWSRRT